MDARCHADQTNGACDPRKGQASNRDGKMNGTDVTLKTAPNVNVRHIADAFHDVAENMRDHHPEWVPRPVVSLANGAFALELYLKSLNAALTLGKQIHGESSVLRRGHDPSKLYDALYAPVRAYLDSKYTASPLSAKHPNLRTLLAAYDGVFEEQRYIFEGQYDAVSAAQHADLLVLLDFMRETITWMDPIHLP